MKTRQPRGWKVQLFQNLKKHLKLKIEKRSPWYLQKICFQKGKKEELYGGGKKRKEGILLLQPLATYYLKKPWMSPLIKPYHLYVIIDSVTIYQLIDYLIDQLMNQFKGAVQQLLLSLLIHKNWNIPQHKGEKGKILLQNVSLPMLQEVLSIPARFCLFCVFFCSVLFISQCFIKGLQQKEISLCHIQPFNDNST